MRNLLVMLGMIAVSFGYLLLSPTFLQDEYGLVFNFGLAPAVWCVILGYFLVGRLPMKLIFMPTIPIAHVLVFGVDAAKPYLANLLAAIEFVPLFIGCIVGHILSLKRTE